MNNRHSFIIYLIAFSVLLFASSCSNLSGEKEKGFTKLRKNLEESLNFIDTARMDEKTAEFVINGSKLQQQDKDAEAILEFQQALRYDSSASIYYAIAKSYKDLQKYDLAVENILIALELDKEFIPAMELLANIFMLQYDIERALTTFEKIVELEPTRKNRISLAVLYEYDNPQKAIEIYEKLIEEHRDKFILERLAEIYQSENMDNKYIKSLNTIYSESPSDVNTAISIITEYLRTGNYFALDMFLNQVDKNLFAEDLYSCYGIIAETLLDGDTTSNSKEFISGFLTRIDNRFRFSWRINLMSAYLAENIKEYDNAEKFYKHSVKITDNMPEIPLQAASFYFRREDDKGALDVLKKNYYYYYSEDWRYPFYIAIAYQNLDSVRKALDYTMIADSLDPENIDIVVQLGILYDQLEIIDSSDIAYERALAIDSTNALANNNYAYSLSVREMELDRAEKMSKIALNQYPDNSAYLDTYGWIQYKLGNIEKALEYIQRSIEVGNASAEVFEHLGDIYKEKGLIEQSIEAYRNSLEKDENNAQVKTKIETLEKKQNNIKE